MKKNRIKKAVFYIFMLLTANLTIASSTNAPTSKYTIETVAKNLNFAWSFCFLDQETILFSEISGRLRLIQNGKLKEQAIQNVPDIYRAGQGGLMDVKADNDFAENNIIYLSYSIGSRNANTLRLLKAKLVDGAITNPTILFTATPMRNTAYHYGGRILQRDDDSLLLTIGDGYNYREQAQKLDNHFGKIIRIHSNGSTPKNNPFVNKKNALKEIWSYGHRNPQGLVSANGNIYSSEHGPKGGDEINLIKPGYNYGWPVITYGVDYNGAQITPYTQYPNMQQPIVNWTPSIAPASLAFYSNKQFPSLNSSLLSVSLAERSIRKTVIKEDKLISDHVIFSELNQRIRDIKVHPNGDIYILTDGEKNQLLRIRKQ